MVDPENQILLNKVNVGSFQLNELSQMFKWNVESNAFTHSSLGDDILDTIRTWSEPVDKLAETLCTMLTHNMRFYYAKPFFCLNILKISKPISWIAKPIPGALNSFYCIFHSDSKYSFENQLFWHLWNFGSVICSHLPSGKC